MTITIRIMWSSREEMKKAIEIAKAIAEMLNAKPSKVYRNRRNSGGRIYIRVDASSQSTFS